ncbi:MAG: MATE family efflux transporter [Lactobacillales bacterium]|jgi:putative MATE family efflux protein|nr:MATE family efflux transporter [Lactobacillales bacterium]
MKDLTSGKPWKVILLFTLPLFVGNFFQQMYAFTDMLVVGRTLGKQALAAIGSTGSLIFLIVGFATGLTSGFSILTAQHFGAKDAEKVRRSFATSIFLTGIATVILTGLIFLFLRPILELMQTPTTVIDQANSFFQWIVLGIFATMAFNLFSNMLRAIGDSKTPLFFLILSTILNLLLELLFILVFRLGVNGAGLATLLAQVVSSLLCLFYIYRKVPILQVRRADFLKLKKVDFFHHVNVGVPMAFQSCTIAIGAIVLQFALNSLGEDVVAAQSTSSKIDQFAILPMMSFGIAMATYVAQNWGAKKYKRILKGVSQGLYLSISFSIIAGISVIYFGESLERMFVSAKETRVIILAKTYFKINGSMYWVLSILFILRYTLQGLGKVVAPTIAGIVELIMRSCAAIFLTVFFGFIGAACAGPLAWIGSVLVLLPSYLSSYQKLRKM